ncbi:MAG: hypothetical protein ACYS8Y_02680 [Planctomycetota bacterium]|jgi:hypothetical protein
MDRRKLKRNTAISSIKEHLDNIADELNKLSQYTTGPDEFVAVNDIELAVYNARKVFERTKNIYNENSGE